MQLAGIRTVHRVSRAWTTAMAGRLKAAAAGPLLEMLSWPSVDLNISQAVTLPAAWYGKAPQLQELEENSVFRNSWQWAGWREQLCQPGDFFTGQLISSKYVVCMDAEGKLRAFHNVCQHHAMAVAEGCGSQANFQCPYHGWTYGLDGKLLKATRVKGIENFKASQYGLVPIHVDTWGPFIFLRLSPKSTTSGPLSPAGTQPGDKGAERSSVAGWLGEGGQECLQSGVDDALIHVETREYTLQCNWKVFCDNYLDGGYHVPFAHGNLNRELDATNYQHKLYPRLSVQTVPINSSKATDRYKGSRAPMYIFVYPNLMINRYGPWMDTNLVLPLTPTSCKVRFDWFVEPSVAADAAFVSNSIKNSEQVQQEDIWLCEGVQAGLSSPAYDSGRYAPTVEGPMFHFHQTVYKDVMALLSS